MTPLTEKILAAGKVTAEAHMKNETCPCIECGSTQYDESEAVYLMVGTQLMAFYCKWCFYRCYITIPRV